MSKRTADAGIYKKNRKIISFTFASSSDIDILLIVNKKQEMKVKFTTTHKYDLPKLNYAVLYD